MDNLAITAIICLTIVAITAIITLSIVATIKR